MNNALLYLGGLLVVTLAALFAVPHFVDWNGYRGVFEEEASKVLGRDVRVGGAVNVRFLPTPYVRFEKVRLADPTGQTGESFVRAESFTMRLSGPALLRGVLEANEIELHRPELTLALDAQGGGNWTSVQIKPGALPFVPQDVALHSVKIIDGAIALFNADAQPIARADAVNGEFSAEALKGPFKFKGDVQWSGEKRQVKFATTAPDPTGAFQIKANIAASQSATTYALDARVENLSTKPRLVGDLTGKIPLQTATATNDPALAVSSAPAAAIEAPVMELKSRIEADTAGAKITDIALAVENVIEPQLISGTATAVWGNAPRLDIALASKWIDLDRLAGAGQDSATFFKIKHLGLSVLRALAGDGAAAAKIDIDQVKLGGENAGAMKIDAERVGAAVRLKQLKAGLPGGSRLDLSGDLKDDNGKVSFSGSGVVHGTNIARLLDWAAKSGANLDIKADGPFSAEGHVLIADNRLELTEASADIGGRPFSGDVVVSGDTRRRVAVTLEAASIDTSEVFPDTAKVLDASLRRALGVSPAQGAATATPASGAVEANPSDKSGDISVRVLAGEVKHQNQIYRNVDATVGMDGGAIRIPSARFTTASGLVANIDARISGATAQPRGMLSYDFVASTPAAVGDLASITGLASAVSAPHLARIGSAKVAGVVRLGNRGPSSADVSVDGTLQSARIVAHAELDGGLQEWRTETSRIRMSARAPSLAPLLGAFGIENASVSQPSAHEVELVFASTGRLAAGAAATLELTGPGLDADYNGRVVASADQPVSVAGQMRIKASDAMDVLAIAGVMPGRGSSGVPIEGTIDLSRDTGKWTVASRLIQLGGTALKGAVSLTPGADGQTTLSGDMQADVLSVAGLLAPLHEAASQADTDATGGIWPAGTFTFKALSGLLGDVRLSFGVLSVQPGMSARDGTALISVAPDKASITSLTGKVAGGALSGAVHLTKASSGVMLDGDLKIDRAELSQLGASARGQASVAFKASSQAQSPAGLLAVLAGSGAVTLDGATIPTPGAAAGVSVINAVMSNTIANQPEAVSAAFQDAISASSADLGQRTIPFVIVDGIAKLDAVTLEGPQGTVSNTTFVDLTSLALDSAWKLAAVVPPVVAEAVPGWTPPPPKGPLPPAAVVYTGSLGELSELAVNVDVSDMQRELAVRQIERNVEELERLRRLDEYRAKLDVERRKALDAERAAAKAAASAPPPTSPPSSPPALPPVLPESAGTAPDTQSSTDPGDAPLEDGAVAPAVVERPQPAVRPQPARASPQRPAQPRRTTSDELMRSLGGIP